MTFTELKPGQVVRRSSCGTCADVVYIDEGKRVALLLIYGRICTIDEADFDGAGYTLESGPKTRDPMQRVTALMARG